MIGLQPGMLGCFMDQIVRRLTRAAYGDSSEWDNPQWGPSTYEFLPESLTCPFYQPGDEYYYADCPGPL